MKKTNLPHLRERKAKGRSYWYFERYKERTRLPDPDSDDFLHAYQDALSGRVRRPAKRNFAKLIEEYKRSPKWQKLAPRTKKDYGKVIEYLQDNIADDDPAKMIRRDVIEAQLSNTHRARFANEIPAMLSRLFEYGINLGWLTVNPARGVEKLRTGDGHKPWPPALVDAYTGAATGVDALIFELAIGTGQRISDLLKMRWSDIEGDGINVTQSKTGTELWIPFTSRLREVISATPKSGFWLITTVGGGQMHYNTAEQRFRAIRKTVDGQGYVMHGWRYTAAHELAQAGCSDAEIAAITGHKSVEMVAKYSRKANQRGLAMNAQEKRK